MGARNRSRRERHADADRCDFTELRRAEARTSPLGLQASRFRRRCSFLMNTSIRYASVSLGVVFAATALSASSPKFFQAATQSEFLKGDVENLSLDSYG